MTPTQKEKNSTPSPMKLLKGTYKVLYQSLRDQSLINGCKKVIKKKKHKLKGLKKLDAGGFKKVLKTELAYLDKLQAQLSDEMTSMEKSFGQHRKELTSLLKTAGRSASKEGAPPKKSSSPKQARSKKK